MPRRATKTTNTKAENYKHPTADSPSRPDIGVQAQFKKRKPPAKYRYDDSLDPQMSWDEGKAAREEGEALIHEILEAENLGQAKAAASRLKAMSQPFLNWAGKAEQAEFTVPTLPLFVHERLSTKAIIDTLKGHRKGPQQLILFADPQHSTTDQVLRAYEHRDKWVNRMIFGDSLVVMNSLLHYEGLGGQVQTIYMDGPYGVKFGSNFQPFVRKRDVTHNDDEDMTYEPEMVKAYRDTWELGLHSYLTYLRDRFTLCRELLAESGSIFVQIGDENVHHVRELMDEVFGKNSFISLISFKKAGGQSTNLLAGICDYLLWYSKEKDKTRFRSLFLHKILGEESGERYSSVELSDGSVRPITREERNNPNLLPGGARVFLGGPLLSEGASNSPWTFKFEGKEYKATGNKHWKISEKGMYELEKKKRIFSTKEFVNYKQYFDDFPLLPLTSLWEDTMGTAERNKVYVVQTVTKVIQRCLLMTTDPGDLVFDPTCGSGTTAFVAEQWGRRWITCDVSRVPLALARQRLLTATFPWFELKDESRGPASGFVYKRKQNRKGDEVGGIVPHITLKSIANDEPPQEEVLVDRPEVTGGITRVSGPFAFEATLPTAMDVSSDDSVEAHGDAPERDDAKSSDRLLEVLRKVKTLQLAGNRTIELRNVRIPAKTLSLSAEAIVEATSLSGVTLREAVDEAEEKNKRLLPLSQKTVAFVFGPENGAVSERLVFEAAREAYAKTYAHLFVIGFGIEANARLFVEKCEEIVGIKATYVEATRDVLMGDLLKNMRSSQVFSVCGLPEVRIRKIPRPAGSGKKADRYEVELLGVDVFDPVTMTSESRPGSDVPAWFLDTDYNGLVFHVCQAFFPRTSAWDNLKNALRAEYSPEVWDHLAGTTSAPFEGGDHGEVAVKVIDDRGNELLVVKNLTEAQ